VQSKRERGTSTFDAWLRTVENATGGLQRAQAFSVVARLAVESFRARLWFVEIFGRRRSYFAGCRSQTPAGVPIERIPLGSDVRLLSDDWGSLSGEDRARLIVFLRELASPGQES